ncbi:hypothetical protein ACLOJK_017982 [Asimina triloba]
MQNSTWTPGGRAEIQAAELWLPTILVGEMASPRRASSDPRTKPFQSVKIAAAIRQHPCPICLRSIHPRRAAVIKACFHAYCIDCIRKWSDLKRNCPLCNTEFDRWFFNYRVSNGDFEEERLPESKDGRKAVAEGGSERRRSEFRRWSQSQRLLSRSRDQLHSVHQRSRPFPWRRSFGQSTVVRSHQAQRNQAAFVAERVLQWRSSIYRQRLQAIPLLGTSRVSIHQKMPGRRDAKEQILRHIEPWIRRELQAILGDSDSSVIVHLATSLWILSLQEKLKEPSKVYTEDMFAEKLRPFLDDHSEMFWHELRCFAESSLTIEAYDSVVEYKRLDST